MTSKARAATSYPSITTAFRLGLASVLMVALALLIAAPLHAQTSAPPTPAAAAKGGVMVFGGTGSLGAEIVRALLAKGEAVTVFARPSSDRKRLAGLDVEYVVGDLMKPEDVAAALKGRNIRAVVDAASSVGNAETKSFYSITTRNIVAAAKAAGVGQVIINSSIGAGASEKIFTAPDAKTKFPTLNIERMRPVLQDKFAAERAVAESGLTYVILRNGVIDPEGSPATGRARLTEDQTSFSRTTRADIALAIVGCLDAPACVDKTYHIVDDSLIGPRPNPGQR